MLLKDIQENFPFIAVVHYGGREYVGVIINQDQHVTSMYVYSEIMPFEDKKRFIQLAEIWWWESNRMIPINIFLRHEMQEFRYAIVTLISKDVTVTIGPTVNIGNLAIKRVKRKSIQLVKKPK